MSGVMIISLIIIYLMSDSARISAFRNTLKSEAITKANLFLENRVDAPTMQHIYLNNTQFINEVEVAVYTQDFEMLYHDAQQHDIVKETPEMIAEIVSRGEMDIDVESGYQAVGILYNGQYVVTASAHDGYGEANMHSLRNTLSVILLVSVILMILVGYYLAIRTIKPIEKALASQRMFVSNVSHELRTPLAVVMGELGLALQRERTAEEYQERIERALQDTQKMSDIVIGLLNMARADYDMSQIKMDVIRIDELIMDVRDELLRAKPDYHINVQFADVPESDEAVSVRANRYLLALAFRNLIENNCKYSKNRTSEISISAVSGSPVISFSDSGIGMSDDVRKNVFEIFYRGEGNGESGHGIGMALVQRIVSLHGFGIEVTSKEGVGTRFVVRM